MSSPTSSFVTSTARASEFACSKIPASFKPTSYTINKPRPKKEFLEEFLGSNVKTLPLFLAFQFIKERMQEIGKMLSLKIL